LALASCSLLGESLDLAWIESVMTITGSRSETTQLDESTDISR
jgi:hypothetical protein